MDYASLVGQFLEWFKFVQDGFLWDISYGQHEIDVTAVSAPEPSSLLLLFLGLAALALYANGKCAKRQTLLKIAVCVESLHRQHNQET